jgi:LmbE family N-acetylglucosaminyl deacetylase
MPALIGPVEYRIKARYSRVRSAYPTSTGADTSALSHRTTSATCNRMRKSVWWAVEFSAVTMCLVLPAWGAPSDQRPLELANRERLLVVAPHPDDETLAAGGLVQRVRTRGGTTRVVILTAGDGYVEAVMHETGKLRPRPVEYLRYGERRMREARAALRQLAPDGVRLQFLGFPDGGLHALLHAHWWRSWPEYSPTTRAAKPPYSDVLEPDCPYDGDDLRRELENILRDVKPTIIVFPDLHDRHPDHRATGLFTMLAVADWLGPTGKVGIIRPRLLTYLIHWPDWPAGWQTPVPQGEAAQQPLELPAALAQEGAIRVLTLTDHELATKRVALQRYTTQQQEMPALLAAFVRRTEPFRLVDVSQLTHIATIIEQHVPKNSHAH